MSHYDVFRHHLAIKFPAYGHALWEPDPGNLYPAVEIGDVGYICEGKFRRLFNVLLPANHPTHRNFGVPEYHEQLTLNMEDHILIGRLSPNNFCSDKVTPIPVSEWSSNGPDDIPKVSFSCRRKEGAVLSLPVPAKMENTVASADFGRWIVKHIDRWFVWARQLGLGIDRMEDIILVTGTHCSRSWTNVVFPGGEGGGQASFGAKVDHYGDTVAINWQVSYEHNRGAVLNCGPNGMDLPEDQCIFIRGFRATRKLKILPPRLKAAAGPNPDPEGYDEEPDAQLIPVPAFPDYQDPLHILLEYIAEGAPLNCDMLLVHDDDFVPLAGIYDSTPLADLQPDVILNHLRNLKPILRFNRIDLSSACDNVSVDTEFASALVAALSNTLDEQLASLSTPPTSLSPYIKISSTAGELSRSSTSFRDDLLILTPAASFPQQNAPDSIDTLPEHATDHFVYAQRLDSAQQPESGPIHPLLPFSGEIPSHDFTTPDSSGSERPHPKAYANQTPADNFLLNKNASHNSFFRRSQGPGSIFSTGTAASSTVTLTPSIMTFASSTPTLVNTSRSTKPHVHVASIEKSSDPISPIEAPQRLDSAQEPESGPIYPQLPSSGEIPLHEFITIDSSGSERPHPKVYANQTPADSLSLNKNLSRNSFFRLSPGSGSIFSTGTAASSTVTLTPSIMTFASSTPTLVNTTRSTQPHARVGSIGKSRGHISRVEEPLVILRVQVLSCRDLVAKGRNGYSDPFVVVSLLGNEFRTPVCKRNLNPVYDPKNATFDIPIFNAQVDGLDMLNLKFVVWDKDFIGKDFLGKNALPVNEWFKDTVFEFDHPCNQPIQVGLLSSSTTTILHGSMWIKVGFVHPPHSTTQLDFWKIYNTLANRVLPAGPQADHVGIVTLLIYGAKNLPDWPTVTLIGWDMDPYVKVTIGDEVQSTQVIRHDRNPVWNKQLVFHVRERDLSSPIVLSVFDWNRFSFDDHVGDVKINISQLVSTSMEGRSTGFYSDGPPIRMMDKFDDVPLIPNPKRSYKLIPTLTFRAGYQSYDELRQQVGY